MEAVRLAALGRSVERPMTKPCISLEHSLRLGLISPEWKEWVRQIQDQYVTHLTPLDESLTRWAAECYVCGDNGRLTGEMIERILTTTPARPEWLERP